MMTKTTGLIDALSELSSVWRQQIEVDPADPYDDGYSTAKHECYGSLIALLREHGPALLRDAGDAARYRWLRDEAMKRQFNGQKGEGVFIAHGSPYTGFCAPTRSKLDEIVDAAMHAPGGG